jgi:CHAD domain-containing protein
MADVVVLSVREANLLRKRLQDLLELRDELFKHPDEETVHDLRVASRRAREVLDYLEVALPQNTYQKLRGPAKKITSRLGELRETEVNQKLTEKLQSEELIPPLAAELLLHTLDDRKRNLQQKVNKQMKAGRFKPYEKFLGHLKGSRMTIPASQEVLQRRAEDFYNFILPEPEDMKDEPLHELRILTKKFRYALEIHNRLRHRAIGRFILRIKRLQELLGEIHDLFVFVNLIQEEARKWNDSRLTLIPEALQNAIQVVTARKEKLYPRVNVLLQKILDNTPEEIRPVPRKIVQTSETTVTEVEEVPEEGPSVLKIS